MNIDSINNGIVLDHITAGRGMDVYRILGLDALDCSVALIKNVRSERMGKKDIIKIDRDIDIHLEALGFIDPGITVNIVRDGALVEKKRLEPPERLIGVLRCANPRCITQSERAIEQVFARGSDGRYRCVYCDAIAQKGSE